MVFIEVWGLFCYFYVLALFSFKKGKTAFCKLENKPTLLKLSAVHCNLPRNGSGFDIGTCLPFPKESLHASLCQMCPFSSSPV